MLAFDEFAQPPMELQFRGVEYLCPPPSVEGAAVILALFVRFQVQFNITSGPIDPALLELIAKQTDPLPVLTLSQGVYDALQAAGASPQTIERMGYHGILHWARGADYALAVTRAMWGPKTDVVEEASPKAPASRSRTGRSTASASRTKTASTRTTASPKA